MGLGQNNLKNLTTAKKRLQERHTDNAPIQKKDGENTFSRSDDFLYVLSHYVNAQIALTQTTLLVGIDLEEFDTLDKKIEQELDDTDAEFINNVIKYQEDIERDGVILNEDLISKIQSMKLLHENSNLHRQHDLLLSKVSSSALERLAEYESTATAAYELLMPMCSIEEKLQLNQDANVLQYLAAVALKTGTKITIDTYYTVEQRGVHVQMCVGPELEKQILDNCLISGFDGIEYEIYVHYPSRPSTPLPIAEKISLSKAA